MNDNNLTTPNGTPPPAPWQDVRGPALPNLYACAVVALAATVHGVGVRVGHRKVLPVVNPRFGHLLPLHSPFLRSFSPCCF